MKRAGPRRVGAPGVGAGGHFDALGGGGGDGLFLEGSVVAVAELVRIDALDLFALAEGAARGLGVLVLAEGIVGLAVRA